MSVTVKHLNADSTFLLTFSPSPNPSPPDLKPENGAYTVLIDPWLVGDSIVSASWFAVTRHVIPSHIQHLSEIEEPDVVLVSQSKPDHCHKETLLQLKPEGRSIIVAEPGAAKAIKSWGHFDPNRIIALKKYDPKQNFGNSLRLRIPPLSPIGEPGEVNISFIPARNYITGMHNAFGITYQAPTHTKNIATVPTIDLSKAPKYFHLPLGPISMPSVNPPPPASPVGRPASPNPDGKSAVHDTKPQPRRRPRLSHSSKTASSELLSFAERRSLDSQQAARAKAPQPDGLMMPSPPPNTSFFFDTDNVPSLDLPPLITPLTPPDSPHSSAPGTHHTQTLPPQYQQLSTTPPRKSLQSLPALKHTSLSTSIHTLPLSSSSPDIYPPRPRPLSILYSPHGIPLADLYPYITNHLVGRVSALPLTLLLHSFHHVQNPWYLGGNIMAGATPQGGLALARALMPRVWISAHDEPKLDTGLAVRQTRTQRNTPEEIRESLRRGRDGRHHRLWNCDVRSLDVGHELHVNGDLVEDFCRDLLAVEGDEGRNQLLSPTTSEEIRVVGVAC